MDNDDTSKQPRWTDGRVAPLGVTINGVCRNCGYCPHCGRGRQLAIYNPQPPQYFWPDTYWASPSYVTVGRASTADVGYAI